ncbi:MAG: ATP-binding protein [Clostridia bacterium]|nr:ATP-binding protein [Clostridia bacterium]
MERKFDLNIEKVLENWEVSDAIREIIANALDEQILTNTKEIQIFEEKGNWHIKDFGRGLEYKHLTQKENKEKLTNAGKIIGKFGVGLKDALATFDRRKIDIEIISKFSKITTCQSEKIGFKDVKTLHAIINDPSSKDFLGTEVILKGCSKENIESAKANFLKFSGDKLLEETKFGAVYEKKQNALIYITGIKVATEDNFLFSYNVTLMNTKIKKALNRERSNVSRTAYKDRVQEILLACKSDQVANRIANDFKDYQTGTIHDEVSWIEVQEHACKLINQNRKVVFATPFDLINYKSSIDDACKDGYEIIPIPENLKLKLAGAKDYQGNKIRTITAFIEEYNDTFQFDFIDENKLNSNEKEIFSTKEQLFQLIGGKPKQIKAIKISKTMRKDEKGTETMGLWQSNEGTIIIRRDQLRNQSDFAGTLLHETAHAISGADDVSREFEIELTRIIGLIAGNHKRD